MIQEVAFSFASHIWRVVCVRSICCLLSKPAPLPSLKPLVYEMSRWTTLLRARPAMTRSAVAAGVVVAAAAGVVVVAAAAGEAVGVVAAAAAAGSARGRSKESSRSRAPRSHSTNLSLIR